MAAKLLHSLADDNQDLQKQIGCMTGIFQLFDRHQILTARQKRLPSGNLHYSDGSLERDSDSNHSLQHRQIPNDSSLNTGLNEKRRISTESSRASFSSCSSSLSSLDFKAEVETSFETPSRDTFMNQPSISPRFGRHSLDLRDVVKDSMYRDPRGPSSKSTAKEQSSGHAMKHRDSPRPLQQSKYVDRSYGVEIDEKQSLPIDLRESIRVLSKLREAPWHYGENTKELPRSSHDVKDGHWNSVSKDAPWLAYDGREMSRLSFESRETIKSTPKIKEFPRHSLDSKEGSWRNYNSDSKPNHGSRNTYGATSTSNEKFSSPQQSSSIQNRLPSVVAKLMGLEALPDSSLAGDTQSASTETYSAQSNGHIPRSSNNGFIRPLRVSKSPKISSKDPTSPRRKNPDVVMRPVSNSKFPIEPAPWKQHDSNRNSPKPSLKIAKAQARTPESLPSVYSEIEKRLKDLEFKQSGRDLRALKQILEAMQEKGLLESRNDEQVPNAGGSRGDYEPKATNLNHNSRSGKQPNNPRNNSLSSTIKGSDSARAFDSPIVIMKPAKLVEKSEFSASSTIPIGGFSASHNRNNISSPLKDQSPKNIRRDASPSSTEKKTSITKNTRSPQSQSRSQQFPRENNQSPVKNSGSVSPRLQQKKLELDKRSRIPTSPSDANKSRRQSGKKAAESVSPGGKLRHKDKVVNSQHSEEQMSELSNDSRNFYQGDEISLPSDGVTVDSKLDIEVTSSLRTNVTDGSQSPSLKAMKQLVSETVQKKSTPRLDEDDTMQDLATKALEHPSPISVLDGSPYTDDVASPEMQIPKNPKAGNDQDSKDNEVKDQWKPDEGLSFNSTGSGEINRKKLQSIDHLVQKLRRLNSNHDEARNDYIASLCENSNPDHRYISEILLASGLLLRDLSSEFLTFQLHSSGHPINPELFLVLEQTKASSLLSKEETTFEKSAFSKQNTEKFHRKLIFDSVNEILGAKLGYSSEPWFQPNKLTKKNLSSQKLLKELCFEIEKVQTKKTETCLEDDEEDDGLKSLLCEDVIHGSECWENFNGEIPGVVLDVERLIFKDLVNDIVIGEAAGLRGKSSVRRRKLFGK
ncbi:protein LONGIFOLIA 2-like isoform X2 [Vicia villosa]|uniref:protein LONGIFOLIA 2-like isoform X2 n=1 Tax=Vicia villosa TaxID=3911 RepID=UPI00273C857A|nr:protein LONGIFOLIA 2-like isoform X2 [Vicia villosa]